MARKKKKKKITIKVLEKKIARAEEAVSKSLDPECLARNLRKVDRLMDQLENLKQKKLKQSRILLNYGGQRQVFKEER